MDYLPQAAAWTAVALSGAVHGLNPLSGWMLLLGKRGSSALPRRSEIVDGLAALALGHCASVALLVTAVALGFAWNRDVVLLASVGAMAIVISRRVLSRRMPRTRELHVACHARSSRAAPALCAFAMSTAHGTGWLLVPAFVPLCISESPVKDLTATGSLGVALAVIFVHISFMLMAALLSIRIAGAVSMNTVRLVSCVAMKSRDPTRNG